MRTHTQTYARMLVPKNARTHTCTHAHTHPRTHKHTLTCARIFGLLPLYLKAMALFPLEIIYQQPPQYYLVVCRIFSILLQMQRRKTLDKLPMQANFYPMPATAFLQDEHHRFTILSAQSNGVASLSEGMTNN